MFIFDPDIEVASRDIASAPRWGASGATPLYLFFGWLSDRLGRKPYIVMACLLAAVTTGAIFKGLTHYGNPVLEMFLGTPIAGEDHGLSFACFLLLIHRVLKYTVT